MPGRWERGRAAGVIVLLILAGPAFALTVANLPRDPRWYIVPVERVGTVQARAFVLERPCAELATNYGAGTSPGGGPPALVLAFGNKRGPQAFSWFGTAAGPSAPRHGRDALAVLPQGHRFERSLALGTPVWLTTRRGSVRCGDVGAARELPPWAAEAARAFGREVGLDLSRVDSSLPPGTEVVPEHAYLMADLRTLVLLGALPSHTRARSVHVTETPLRVVLRVEVGASPDERPIATGPLSQLPPGTVDMEGADQLILPLWRVEVRLEHPLGGRQVVVRVPTR
jgi:hypothetical protein